LAISDSFMHVTLSHSPIWKTRKTCQPALNRNQMQQELAAVLHSLRRTCTNGTRCEINVFVYRESRRRRHSLGNLTADSGTIALVAHEQMMALSTSPVLGKLNAFQIEFSAVSVTDSS